MTLNVSYPGFSSASEQDKFVSRMSAEFPGFCHSVQAFALLGYYMAKVSS
jgi:hypothetical protein